ncbi:Bcr/CflA family efflux MFS transporter [Pseudaestuariivita sp.]|uniref:Bcr/CflA family efflux MFS transporter n=1 Tax=Pseudaestuariivita sp. TaxID=2211669 RepID=UPI00405856D2
MTTPRTPPALTTLILLTALSLLSLQMFLPSLANIAEDLETSYATISFAIAGYLAVTAVIQLVVGPLSDRIGRRPVLLATLTLFTLASLGCALATDVWSFLTFRVAQGGVISGYVLSLAIVRDTRPENEAAGLIGYIAMAMAVAPMLGPMLGGALDAAFGWRATFYFYAIAGALMLMICWQDVGETRTRTTGTTRQPVSALLKAPLFWAYALCSATANGAFYIFLTGAPLVAEVQFGVSTAQLGVLIGTITAGFIAGSFLAGRLASHVAPSTMMIAGRLLACAGVGTGLIVTLTVGGNAVLFFASTMCIGVGNGITKPSCDAGAMSVKPGLEGSAAGINGALSVGMGAVLTTLTAVLLPPDEPAATVLALTLLASLAGLGTALLAKRLR